MSRIIAKVVDRTIEFTDMPPIYSGSKNVDDVQFQFDSEWDSFTKTAVFYRDESNQFMAELTSDICTVPHEVLSRDGKIYIGVYGELDDKVITSEVVIYTISRGVLTDPVSSDDPTFWDKLLEIKNDILQAKEDAHTYADEAKDWAKQAEQNAEHFYNGIIAQGETYSGIASNKGIKLHSVVGKTSQKTTNGYQLFDSSKVETKTSGGATVTNNNDGSFTISGSGNLTGTFSNLFNYSKEESLKLLKVGTYKSNTENTTPQIRFGLRNASTMNYVSNKCITGSIKSITLTEEDIQSVEDGTNILSIGFYGSNNNAIVTGTVKPMIYVDGDGTFEEFTGSKPAPNPDYAMPIENVEISNITSHGRQLFDSSKISNKTQGGATLTNNNDGSFTVSGSGTVSELFVINYDITGDTAKSFFKAGRVKIALSNVRPYFYFSFRHSGGIYGDVDSKYYTNFDLTDEMINSDGFYVRCGFQLPQGNEIVNGTIKPMVYQDGDGTWEPFKHASVETSLTLAQDDIYQEGTITRARKQVVLDGSSDEAWAMNESTNGYTRFNIIVNDLKANTPFISNRFDCDLWGEGVNREQNKIWYYQDNRIRLTISDEYTSGTLEGFKTWLSTHNLVVEYELATPTTEEYQVPTVPSYYPYTNVSTDNDLTTDMEWELLGNSDNSLEIEDILKRVEALESKAIGG